jgi:hypothetical protein
MCGVALILGSIMIGYHILPSARTASIGHPAADVTFRYEGPETIVDIHHVYNGGGPGSTAVHGDIIELEIDGEITLIKYCELNCGDPSNTTCYATEYLTYPIVSYNLGEITGTPPKVRARTRSYRCDPPLGQLNVEYGLWSSLKDATVSQPLPLHQIAIMIGAAGIVVVVLLFIRMKRKTAEQRTRIESNISTM